MQRLIQEKIKKPLAEEILFGELSSRGGIAYVDQEEGELVLNLEYLTREKDKVT
jgi:ATP-dependent Clp protease ATP-binding subunit ClpA